MAREKAVGGFGGENGGTGASSGIFARGSARRRPRFLRGERIGSRKASSESRAPDIGHAGIVRFLPLKPCLGGAIVPCFAICVAVHGFLAASA